MRRRVIGGPPRTVLRGAKNAPRKAVPTGTDQESFGSGEKHMGGLEAAALAVVEVENEVVFQDVIGRGEAEFAGGLIDGGAGAFEFDEGADGGFVVVDDKIPGPFQAGRETVGGAVLFVAEPAAQAEAFEDFLEGVGVGEDGF